MRYSFMTISCLLLAGFVTFSSALSQQPPKGFTALFNGVDLKGWKVYGGDKEVWGAENGLLYVDKRGGGWLMTEEEYSDFVLYLEFKLPKMGNSGVALRAPLKGNPAYEGMEIQLIDDLNWKGLKPYQHTGSVYGVIPASKVVTQPPGKWNSMMIVAKGSQIQVTVNLKEVVDDDLSKYLEKHGKAHPGISRKQGHIGLQSYNFRVEFRNIWIKPL